jgi:hypothetical protein
MDENLENLIAIGALREFEPTKPHLKSSIIACSLTGRIVPFSDLSARLTLSDDGYLTKSL